MEVIDLKGRKGLGIGIANEHSLAWWAAKHFAGAAAELAITYLNDKAKPFVAPLAESIGVPLLEPCNVSVPGQLEAAFDVIWARWGRLDFPLRRHLMHVKGTASGLPNNSLRRCPPLIRRLADEPRGAGLHE